MLAFIIISITFKLLFNIKKFHAKRNSTTNYMSNNMTNSLIYCCKTYCSFCVKSARSTSVKQARKVILWDVNEKLAPALPGFPYDFKDMVFIWKWIDYLVFDWLASWHLRKIILLEIKSWQSLLNRNESMIKNAVSNWLVSYEVFRVHI